ncbi:MAG: hypothetical protein ABL957_04215 [Parvularculaceae bacterium]
MAMSAWGLLAAPLMATQFPAEEPEAAFAAAAALTGVEIAADAAFEGLVSMDDESMSLASGGEGTAIDIGSIGVNISDQAGDVNDIEVNDSPTGEIAGNIVSDNGGITTVFNNTGNGVIFQSTVNVNIFTGAEIPTN